MNLSNLFCFQGVRHWNTEYKETKEKSRRWRGNNNRELGPSHPLSHWPTWLSSQSGPQQRSANSFFYLVPLIQFNTQWWTHQISCAILNPYPPPLPLHPRPLLWVFSKEMMKPWKYEKCSSQGSVKEAISIKPMSISCVEENNTSLWCCCTRCSSDSTYAGADRAHITDWWILNYCGGWHLC